MANVLELMNKGVNKRPPVFIDSYFLFFSTGRGGAKTMHHQWTHGPWIEMYFKSCFEPYIVGLSGLGTIFSYFKCRNEGVEDKQKTGEKSKLFFVITQKVVKFSICSNRIVQLNFISSKYETIVEVWASERDETHLNILKHSLIQFNALPSDSYF